MNERDVAKGFSSHWEESFPLLSPNFITAFNEAYVQPIIDTRGVVKPVRFGGNPHNADLLAEFSFALAAAAHKVSVSVRSLSADEKASRRAFTAALDKIRARRTGGSVLPSDLSGRETREALRIARVYERFLDSRPANEAIEFSPRLAGASVLGNCRADLSVGRTLYEVKTVNRNFHSVDLRQLIVYFALEAVGGTDRWQYGGLFNPRLGVFCRFSIDWLIVRLSGGRPPRLVLWDFMAALARDVVLDSRF